MTTPGARATKMTDRELFEALLDKFEDISNRVNRAHKPQSFCEACDACGDGLPNLEGFGCREAMEEYILNEVKK